MQLKEVRLYLQIHRLSVCGSLLSQIQYRKQSYDPSCHMDAAGGGMGQGVGNAAAVTDDVQTIVAALQILVHRYFHIVQ